MKSDRGATLLELLIVLTVMFFLTLMLSSLSVVYAKRFKLALDKNDWDTQCDEVRTLFDEVWFHIHRDFFVLDSDWVRMLNGSIEENGFQRIHSLSLKVGKKINRDEIEVGWVEIKQIADGSWTIFGLDLLAQKIDKNAIRMHWDFDLWIQFNDNGWEGALSPSMLFDPAVMRVKLKPRNNKIGASSTFFMIYPSVPPVKHRL